MNATTTISHSNSNRSSPRVRRQVNEPARSLPDTFNFTAARWITAQQRQPTQDDGLYREELGKVDVWVLTQDDVRTGRKPSLCGFHIRSGQFDDHDSEGEDRVVYWARYERSQWGRETSDAA